MAIRQFSVMDLGKTGLIKPEQLGYKDSLDIIKDESFRIQKSFIKIGWYLKHIRDNELYKEDGYANICECAADQLGYSQSTVSRLINICEKFSKNHNSPEIDVKYQGFDKSQMIEMLSIEPEQLERITPDMTVKQIRDMKLENKAAKEEIEKDIPGQTSIEKDFPEYMPEKENQILGQSSLMDNGIQEKPDMVIDGEYREIEETEPEKENIATSQLPRLKNNDQRKEWLNNYKEWGLWYRDENIDVSYYKYDFEDGSRLVVAEYPQRQCYYNRNRIEDEHYYHLLQVNKEGYRFSYNEKFRNSTDSETYLVDFIKELQKKF